MSNPGPGSSQRDGIHYAKTREGFALPVIDFSDRRFAVPDDEAAAGALYQSFIDGERRRAYIPKFLMRMMLWRAAQESRLVHALFSSEAGFLDSITTYVMKLGPDQLVPPFDTPMDHRFASSPHVPLVRLRMYQIARLMADALVAELAAAPAAPLSFINIGGGPALDSINTLIFLRRDRPDLLNRKIAIEVLDASSDGAFFGANALAALQAGGPLAGIDITLRHHDYNWDEPSMLERFVVGLKGAGAIIVASSEGALFEYGSDQAIVANLQALHASGEGARFVSGSVTGADETRKRTIAATRLKLIPRGLERFAPLASQGGYRIAKSEPAMISDQVLLRPM
jgi:hypothetical protein